MSATSDQITITMKIAVTAAEGNHSVQVKVNGQLSNSVNYYVQYPRKLIRQAFPEEYQANVAQDSTAGVSKLMVITDGSIIGFDGQPLTVNNQPLTHRCGAYRLLLYQLVDAEGQAIKPGNVTVNINETFPPEEQTGDTGANQQTGNTTTNNAGYVADFNGLDKPAGQCLNQSYHSTIKQHFSATVGSTQFPLSTIVTISYGYDQPSNTYTVTNTISTP